MILLDMFTSFRWIVRRMTTSLPTINATESSCSHTHIQLPMCSCRSLLWQYDRLAFGLCKHLTIYKSTKEAGSSDRANCRSSYTYTRCQSRNNKWLAPSAKQHANMVRHANAITRTQSQRKRGLFWCKVWITICVWQGTINENFHSLI